MKKFNIKYCIKYRNFTQLLKTIIIIFLNEQEQVETGILITPGKCLNDSISLTERTSFR